VQLHSVLRHDEEQYMNKIPIDFVCIKTVVVPLVAEIIFMNSQLYHYVAGVIPMVHG